MDHKKEILNKFEDVQNTTPLNAQKEYNSKETIRTELKRKQWEVAGRDILKSFEKYH